MFKNCHSKENIYFEKPTFGWANDAAVFLDDAAPVGESQYAFWFLWQRKLPHIYPQPFLVEEKTYL